MEKLKGKIIEKYWLKQLNGVRGRTLPRFTPHTPKGVGPREVLTYRVAPETRDYLDKASKGSDLAFFLLCLSGVNLTLSKYLGNEFVVGTLTPNQAGKESQIVLCKNQIQSDQTFKELIIETRQKVLEAFNHGDYSFDQIYEKFQAQESESPEDLLQVAVIYRPWQEKREILNRFPLVLELVGTATGLELQLEYDSAFYQREVVEQFGWNLSGVLDHFQVRLDQLMGEIPIVHAEEKERLLNLHQCQKEIPGPNLVQAQFEAQVAKTPDQLALIYKDQQLTYRELNARANQLARVLRARGVQPDQTVGLLINRSLEMYISILGIMKAGGAYIPIDPKYPKQRQVYILNDSQSKVLLTLSHLVDGDQFAEVDEGLQTLFLDEIELSIIDDSNLPQVNQEDHLAYIIYTSGTTGQPKGVLVEHRNIVNAISWQRDEFGFDVTDRCLQLFAFPFDGFVLLALTPLISGACQVIMSDDEALDPLAIRETLLEKEVTIYSSVPLLYSAILENLTSDDLHRVRLVFLGGERVQNQVVQRSQDKNPAMELVNVYGPTENAVVSSIERHMRPERVTVGKPIPNTRAYILDAKLQLVPVGVEGELCVSGAGLARGYLNRPELTAEKFIPHPFEPGERLYRTGDLARWLPDGNIDFLGRMDHQVKIRGYRIELGEIENQILNLGTVQEVVVIDQAVATGEKILCAYLVADQMLDLDALKEALSQTLPEYMLPMYFTQLESLPLTHNGKVDRSQLPSPKRSRQTAYVKSEDWLEEKLVQIWSAVLELEAEKIGVEDNFFEIGGYSLKGITLISKIYHELEVKVKMTDLFQMPTIKKLAQFIRELSDLEEELFSSDHKPGVSYPLSSAQKRLYILQQMDPKNVVYNMATALIWEGQLDQSRLQETIQLMLARHESLRTAFDLQDGEPAQLVQEEVSFNLVFTPLGDRSVEQVVQEFVRPFDLSQAPLFRLEVFQMEDEKYLLLVDLHHIISDGVSMGIFMEDFMALYQGQELPLLRLQYKDFALWQEREREQGKMKAQEDYWLQELAGDLPLLNLPTDNPRPGVQNFAGDVVNFDLTEKQTQALKELAKEEGATLYMLILAVYNILLMRLSGQEDLIVGTPVVGRDHVDLQQIIGMFVNTLALRNQPRGQKTFSQFFAEVKKNTFKAFENQEYQFEDVVENLSLAHDPGRNPIFDVLLTFQNFDLPELEVPDLRLRPYPMQEQTSKFDLSLIGFEDGAKLSFAFEYSTALFKRETILRFVGYFQQLISSILKDSKQRIAELDLLPATEKKRLLLDWNQTYVATPERPTIHENFERWVEKNPDHLALLYQDQQMTYQELNTQANGLASLLRSKGVGKETIVALLVRRSKISIVAMLAVLKAGGAYLPIDPTLPKERTQYMLEDSEAHLVIANEDLVEELDFSGEVICLEQLQVPNQPMNLTLKCDEAQLAYVIYTSGTTGQPKGVMIEHQGITRLVCESELLEISSDDRVSQVASFAFDASAVEIWGALLNGATLCVIDQQDLLSPERLEYWMKRHQVTFGQMTTSLFNYMVQSNVEIFAGLRGCMVGGEVLSSNYVKELREQIPRIKLINGYGPTENTILTTGHTITQDYEHSIPIGLPVANTQVFILGQHNQVQPIGVAGELCVSGPRLARGYLNKPELTNRKFVANPYLPEERMYRTGDLACWRADGTIEFLGRIDHQVKVRGYRIELGEIESKLGQLERIQKVVLLTPTDATGEKVLCAYLVADQPLDFGKIREQLAEQLPDYMIPPYFVQVDEIPLTSNGKVDRKALPEPELRSVQQYIPPRNPLEVRLAELWAQVLGLDVEQIGIDGNFFKLGGHSLKGMTLLSKIYQEYKQQILLTDFYKSPTIRKIANVIENCDSEQGKSTQTVEEMGIETRSLPADKGSIQLAVAREELPEQVMLLNNHQPQNLFCFPDITGQAAVYLNLAAGISSYSVYAFNYLPDLDKIEQYLQMIQQIQPTGPCYLLGYSAGGKLAFEVAKGLEALGREVRDLILIDAVPTVQSKHVSKRELKHFQQSISNLLGDSKVDEDQELMCLMQDYYAYIYKTVTKGKLNCAIHLIYSKELSKEQSLYLWDQLTQVQFQTYPGSGSHFEMLKPGFVEENVKLIQDILPTREIC